MANFFNHPDLLYSLSRINGSSQAFLGSLDPAGSVEPIGVQSFGSCVKMRLLRSFLDLIQEVEQVRPIKLLVIEVDP